MLLCFLLFYQRLVTLPPVHQMYDVLCRQPSQISVGTFHIYPENTKKKKSIWFAPVKQVPVNLCWKTAICN